MNREISQISSAFEKGSRLLLTHRNVMEKVWANTFNNQKELDVIVYFLFGVGVPNPDQSGCWQDEKGPSLTRRKKDPQIIR